MMRARDKRTVSGILMLAALSVLGASGGCRDARRQARMQPSYDETGKLTLLTYDANGDGKPDTWSYMDGRRIVRIEIDTDRNGTIDRWEYYDASGKLTKIGTSRAKNGKPDTWTYPADGGIVRVEFSPGNDGRVTRTEFYEGDALVRAEEDTDADGRVDKWETYADGVMTSVAFDTTGAGHPTRRLDYDERGQLVAFGRPRDSAPAATKH
jgi:hypothetical protein